MQIQRSAWTGVGQSRTTGALNKTGRELNKILQKLSTGMRINQASDDAAGLAVSEALRSQVRGFKMADQNVANALSALQIADGAASEISNLMQRNRELAVQARTDTLTDDQRQAINVEYQANLSEVDRIAQGAQFNTQSVVNGEGLGSGDAEIQAGPDQGQSVNLPEMSLTSASLGIENTSIATAADAAAAMDALDSGLEAMGQSRSVVGARMNQFESTRNTLLNAEINTQAAESVLRDQDMARGMMEFTRAQLLNETGLSAFARYSDISANHIMSLLS